MTMTATRYYLSYDEQELIFAAEQVQVQRRKFAKAREARQRRDMTTAINEGNRAKDQLEALLAKAQPSDSARVVSIAQRVLRDGNEGQRALSTVSCAASEHSEGNDGIPILYLSVA
jgi:hypothetical protein